MGILVNVDNGGTLTDFCALDNGRIYHTKTLTTPFDLSKCFFDGMKKLAREIYGDESRVSELLQNTDYIRYSTTQGTNALVERKGPRLGLLLDQAVNCGRIGELPEEAQLLADLVADRVAEIDLSLSGDAFAMNIVQAVNRVATAGANRIILSVDRDNAKHLEKEICKILGRKFPSHLLGVVPVISAAELADDHVFKRRTWTAITNSFLHPAMERFLYSADHRLKNYKTRHPLLIFRNDGGAARVAKTMAVKTYSSGPCGGMQGAKALARHYGIKKMLTFDVGGTTTDVGLVSHGELEVPLHGKVEGVDITFPISEIYSAGVGGSSIITLDDDKEIKVGPLSVGAAPGPACFGLGGTHATITDVFLLLGVLDPATYFGGELELNDGRAREVIADNIMNKRDTDEYQTLMDMLNAWVEKIASSLKRFTSLDEDTVLAGFGGAGALAATRIAEAVGVKKVIIPELSAVFSAFGIGFSPLAHEYRVRLTQTNDAAFQAAIADTMARAKRDFFAEGVDIGVCDIRCAVVKVTGHQESVHPVKDMKKMPCGVNANEHAVLLLRAEKNIASLTFKQDDSISAHEATAVGERKLLVGENRFARVPVYRPRDLAPGASASGPAIIEQNFLTGFVDKGWKFSIFASNDIVLERL